LSRNGYFCYIAGKARDLNYQGEHVMKLRYLFLLLLIGFYGCNNEQPSSTPSDTGAAGDSDTQGATEQTTEAQPNDSSNPEIVPPQKAAVKVTHVISSEETYYLDGPQQMRPPDGKFKAGTKVELVQEAGSYSVVVSEDGIRAYVSSGALKPIE
jgi:hypothetical protein